MSNRSKRALKKQAEKAQAQPVGSSGFFLTMKVFFILLYTNTFGKIIGLFRKKPPKPPRKRRRRKGDDDDYFIFTGQRYIPRKM